MRSATPQRLGLTALLAAVVFADLTVSVVRGGAVVRADNRWSVDMLRYQHPWSRHVAVWLSDLGSPGVVAGALVVATLVMMARRDWWHAVLVPVVSVAALELGQTMRHQIGRSGPTGGSRLHVRGIEGGYPSGHVLGAALAAMAVAFACRSRRVAGVVATLAVLVALARIYLFAHYPSDVLASLLAATSLAAAIEATTTGRSTGRSVGTESQDRQ